MSGFSVRKMQLIEVFERHKIFAKNALAILLVAVVGEFSVAQTCTLSGSGTIAWDNASPPTCTEGGNAGSASVIKVPAGVTLDFDNNGDTWTGTRIEIQGASGSPSQLTISASGGVILNASVTVKNFATLYIESKLNLGTAGPSCNYNLIVESGGTVDLAGTSGGSDRLEICDIKILQGGGACNDCGGTNSGTCAYNGQPYCESGGGFTGPIAWDKDGYNGTLPVELAYLRVGDITDEGIRIDWATASEKNFDKFIIQRSVNGKNFYDIGELTSKGNGTQFQKYSFIDQNPVIGNNYYRLKSLDLDLSYEYSFAIFAAFKGSKKVLAYPNPTEGKTINLLTNFQPSGTDVVQVFDNLGMRIAEFPIAQVNSNLDFAEGLERGVYLLRYTSKDHQQIIRFTVK